MKRLHTLLLILLVAAAFVACDGKVHYCNDQRVDEHGWNLGDKLYFDVDVDDTTRLYSFFIDLRVSSDFPYSNAFLFVNTTRPDGGISHDTIECPLADASGQWYGKRTGRYIDNRYAFRKNMIFPSTGEYRFEIVHAMRDTNVLGIKNVGLRIEYVQ